MVVKNDPQDLWLISCSLQIQGYDTVALNQGRDAIQQAWNQNVDCVLVDADLKDMSGYEVCYRLKHDDITKMIPIIIVNQNDDPKSRESCYRAGANDLILAPVSILDADLAIDRLIKTNNKRGNHG
jgi:putative two-component system response regulator